MHRASRRSRARGGWCSSPRAPDKWMQCRLRSPSTSTLSQREGHTGIIGSEEVVEVKVGKFLCVEGNNTNKPTQRQWRDKNIYRNSSSLNEIITYIMFVALPIAM